MTDSPKLNLGGFGRTGGLMEGKMGSQKIPVLDHINGFQYTAEKSDSFVIDMEGFSHGITTTNKDHTSSPRITLQRSLSRKGSQRCNGSEKKINPNTPNDKETVVPTSSPRGPISPDTGTATSAVGTTDHSSNPKVHHQITISTSNINSPTEGRGTTRRNSIKRYPPIWVLDPKRVLFFFATLSSMGTMLLIYFTLSMGKISAAENALD